MEMMANAWFHLVNHDMASVYVCIVLRCTLHEQRLGRVRRGTQRWSVKMWKDYDNVHLKYWAYRLVVILKIPYYIYYYYHIIY